MKLIDKKYMDKYNNEDYVWYACYGSNINYKRFMHYIDGDITGNIVQLMVVLINQHQQKKDLIYLTVLFILQEIVKDGMVEDLLFLIMNILAKVMGKYIN